MEMVVKRAVVVRVEGRRSKRRLRWENCLKRELTGVGMEKEGEGRGVTTGGGEGNEAGEVT